VDVTYDGIPSLPVHPGSYAVAATVVQPSYTGSATGTLTVTPAGQTIAFGPLPGVSIGDPPLTLTGTASSGLPVSYASSDPSVASVSGNVVTIQSVGTTNITASQAGNGDYLAAAPVAASLVVSPVTASVSLGNLAQTYDGTPKSASVTTSPGGLSVSVTYDGGSTPPIHAGSYAVVATVTQAGFTGSASGTLGIAKASQTVTFGPLSNVTVGSPPVTLTGTASSGLPVTYTSSNPSVATVSGNTATIVAAGTTNITANQTGNTDYLAAAPVVQPLTVALTGPAVPALPPVALLALAALLVAAAKATLSRRRRRD
jgi:hypothetical protein